MKHIVGLWLILLCIASRTAIAGGGSIRPILECIRNNGDGSYTAFFGYLNESSATVAVPVGRDNKFWPSPSNQGQPTIFLPGRHSYIFSVTFDCSKITWTLKRRTVSAFPSSPRVCAPRDTTPPSLSVSVPAGGLLTAADSISITGNATDAGSGVTVHINGTIVPVRSGGTFTGFVGLQEGMNTLTVSARDTSNNAVIITRNIRRDSTPPRFEFEPADGLAFRERELLVHGSVIDSTRVLLAVNGDTTSLNADGTFSLSVLLQTGVNLLSVVATDAAGNSSAVNRTVYLDMLPPDIAILTPDEGITISHDSIEVRGRVSDSTAVVVTANGTVANLYTDGTFSSHVELMEGTNEILVTATDAAGNSTSRVTVVTRRTIPPAVAGPQLARPTNGTTTHSLLAFLSWHPSDTAAGMYQLQVASDSFFTSLVFNDSTIANTSRMMTVLDPATRYYWRVSTKSMLGRSAWSAVWHFSTRPDTVPVIMPSKIDPTVTSLVSNTNRFLYIGENRVQFGVDTARIAARRFATLRGAITTRDEMPIPGVRVSILRHPEFGYTFTQQDGQFDMVVNGGGLLTVEFAKNGYLDAQRSIHVPWQDYALLDTVALVRLDTVVTTVNLEDSTGDVVRGSVVMDEDGSRRATMFFEPGVTATLLMSDSSALALSSLHIRATEFTVGPNGPRAMPAKLPPASAYTYCVEITADEALAVGARRVKFSEPVPFYVENFVGFPVGVEAPLGNYDPEIGNWVAYDNGLVLKIVDTLGGVARIDVTGDGVADTGAALRSRLITSTELTRLATVYSPGQSLWRVQIPHLCAWDINWGFEPPAGARSPFQPPCSCSDELVDNGNCGSGSIIHYQDQSLGEELGVAGTPYRLMYNSQRVPGRKIKNEISVPSTMGGIPGPLAFVKVSATVAGREITKYAGRQAERIEKLQWDGSDAYGRKLQGAQIARVTLSYAYKGVYKPTGRFGYSGFGVPISGERATSMLYFDQPGKTLIGGREATAHGLGGWSLDVNHTFDVLAGTVFYGNGSQRQKSAMQNSIRSVAGNGVSYVMGDGGPATTAGLPFPGGIAIAPDGTIYVSNLVHNRVRRINPDGIITTVNTGPLNRPTDVELGPDGTLYIADEYNSRIQAVRPDGRIETVAGRLGQYGFSGDGGRADQAMLARPNGVAIGPDGSLYISDQNNFRVRRVGLDGIMTTVAGGGHGGDSIPATQSRMDAPGGVLVGPDGILYIAELGNTVQTFLSGYRVRTVTTDGRIYTIAGAGRGFGGDDEPAANALLKGPISLALAPDGSMIVADYLNGRVRMISPDGIIRTIAGGGFNQAHLDERPLSVSLSTPVSVAMGPDGTLYISVSNDMRIYALKSPVPNFQPTDYAIPSEDASELFVFNSAGKHLRTVSPLNGKTLLSFGYDSLGRVASIRDIDSLVTRIERDSTGSVITLIAPFGQQTKLTLDSTGYLAASTNDAGATTHFAYDGKGLLLSKRDPRNSIHIFEYDSLGRLVKDIDPAGGFTALSQEEYSSSSRRGYNVLVSTAEGNKTSYRVNYERHVSPPSLATTDATGLRTETAIFADGRSRTRLPDGTIRVDHGAPDPRYGLAAPLPSLTLQTPGGLQFAARQSRIISQMTGQAVTGITDTLIVNGRAFITAYNGQQRLLTSTTAAGRRSFTWIDSLGRTVKDSVPEIAPMVYTYDSLGFLRSVAQTGRVTIFEYNNRGLLARITDPLNRTASLSHDTVGRVTRQVLADGREILYAYDANGNLLSLTPPGKPAHNFAYTVVDLTHRYAPPELPPDSNWATDYLYDLDKQLTHTLLPGGDSIVVRYDTTGCGCSSMPRPAEIKFDRGAIKFSYDPATGNARLIVAPGGDTLSYTYDGSLPISVKWNGNVNGTVAVKYDNNFRVIQQTVNGVDSVGFVYDRDGLLREVGSFKINRDPLNGLFRGDTLGSIVTNVGYNSLGEMSTYEAKHGSASLFATAYQRDSLGRITQLTETVQGVATVHGYTYDLAGRLKQVRRNDTLQATYFYDANGNRDSVVTPEGTTRGTYDAQDRMLTYGNASYFYTRRGSLSMKVEGADTTRYTYDLMGNLMKVELPDGDENEYLIDAQNRRVGKKLNGQVVARWIYSGQLAPVAQVDSVGNIAARYMYATHVNIPDYIVTDSATYRVITDHLGSLRLVVNDATGEVIQRMDYDAWGNVLADSNPGFTPFGFAGGMYENATMLVRFGARDYEAMSGRWTAKDPIKFFGDLNFYCYVKNQPLVGKDPTGLWSPQAHDEIVRHALEGKASSAQIRTLQILGRHFDETTQSPEESFKHSMRSPFQTRDEAKRDRDAFITRNLSTARQLCDMGFENLALEFLTRALHPIMDSFSPMHREASGDPKLWKGIGPSAIGHSLNDFIGRETTRNISQLDFLALDAILQQAYSYVFRR